MWGKLEEIVAAKASVQDVSKAITANKFMHTLTSQFVAPENKLRQLRQVSKGSGDRPCENIKDGAP